jgi:hypothetical protein
MNVPLLLALGGLLAIAAAAMILRRLGRGYRVARMLSAAPEVSIAEARVLADGRPRFVRVHGRVESDEEFPDENERPLVFRRERLEVRRSGHAWETIQEDRVAVPFGVEERSAFIGVDVDAIAGGLVVMPREAVGRAAEVVGRIPADVPADADVRLRVEQVSAVEQASVAGVPRPGPAGQPWMTAGTGRPLILTTMEIPSAMRLLAEGRRGHVMTAVACLAAGTVLLLGAMVLGVAQALGFLA